MLLTDDDKRATSDCPYAASVSYTHLDVYKRQSRDHVFANAQTGNMVLLAINIKEGSWLKVFLYLMPIPVSYTHLDVYKRQDFACTDFGTASERAFCYR